LRSARARGGDRVLCRVMEEDRMVPSFPGIIPSESPRLSCPEFEERSLASRAIRVWHAGQDPRIAGCLQAIMAWRYCPFADRIGLGYSSARDSESEESYCFAPQLVQNVFPGARGTPQERHFPVAFATTGIGVDAGAAGVYWRDGCTVGAY